MKRLTVFVVVAAFCLPSISRSQESETKDTKTAKIFDSLTLTIPDNWKEVQPKSRIVEREFTLKLEDDKESKSRVTFMAAGGGVDANIERWEGQFSEKPDAEVEELSVADQTVHFVKLAGTFKETMGGPFAGGKTVMQENYEMLAAVVEMKNGRLYFIKLIGPQDEVKPQEESFKKMLQEIKG